MMPIAIQSSVGLPIQFRKLESKDVGLRMEPTLSFSFDEAQRLMDELWRVGLRLAEGSGSAGSLAATERHLDDMRALVFKTFTVTPQK